MRARLTRHATHRPSRPATGCSSLAARAIKREAALPCFAAGAPLTSLCAAAFCHAVRAVLCALCCARCAVRAVLCRSMASMDAYASMQSMDI